MYKYTIFPIVCLLNYVCRGFLELFVSNRQIKRILRGKLAKLYLHRYVKKVSNIDITSCTRNSDEQEKPHIIWQYWEQGIKNAPSTVKQCIKSVEKFTNGNQHIILDLNSISQYIKIPQYIMDMHKKGLIRNAAFSDYLRTALLSKYGGTWIDATVLFTDNLPDFIIKSDLFVFQNELNIDFDGLNIASYFISAKPHHELIEKLKLLLEIYWKENFFMNDYFFYLHAFTMLTQANKHNKELFAKVPFFSFIPVQRFQFELMTPYTNTRWEQIKKISFVHKLSYKQKIVNKENLPITNTFLEKLQKGELE